MARSYGGEVTWTQQSGGSGYPCTAAVGIHEVCHFYYSSSAGDCEFHFFDCSSFGDLIDNQHTVAYLRAYLSQAHREWTNLNVNKFREEDRNLADNRMHLLISVHTAHILHSLSLQSLTDLAALAPIVPVVTKADCFTMDERRDFLLALQRAVQSVAIFDFQEDDCGAFLLPDNNHELNEEEDEEEDEDEEEEERDEDDDETEEEDVLSQEEGAGDSKDALDDVSRGPEGDSTFLVDRRLSSAEHSDAEHSDSCVEEVQYSSHMSSAAGRSEEASVVHPQALPRARNIFAVICSDEASGKRIYPWGEVSAFDEHASDFRRLQRLVFESGRLVTLRSACQEMSMALLRKEAIPPAPAAATAAPGSALSRKRLDFPSALAAVLSIAAVYVVCFAALATKDVLGFLLFVVCGFTVGTVLQKQTKK